jgi:hypothetical protein
MEEWKQIKGFSNYSISNLGNIRNNKKGNLLKPSIDGKGYYVVRLYIDNKNAMTNKLHRLLGIHFLPNPNDYLEIDHIDRNKLNNSLDNLRWCNRTINLRNRGILGFSSNKYKNITWSKRDNVFRVGITINNKQKYLGSYKTEEEAVISYNKYILEHKLEDFYDIIILDNV